MTETDSTEMTDDETPRLDVVWRNQLRNHGISDADIRRQIVSDVLSHEQLLFGSPNPDEYRTVVQRQLTSLDLTQYLSNDAIKRVSESGIKNSLEETLEQMLVNGIYRRPAGSPPGISGAGGQSKVDLDDIPRNLASGFEAKEANDMEADGETDARPDNAAEAESNPTPSEEVEMLETIAEGEFELQNVAKIKQKLRPLLKHDERSISTADIARAIIELQQEGTLDDT